MERDDVTKIMMDWYASVHRLLDNVRDKMAEEEPVRDIEDYILDYLDDGGLILGYGGGYWRDELETGYDKVVEIEHCMHVAEDYYDKGRVGIACQFLSEGLRCIGIEAFEYWHEDGNSKLILKKHSRLGAYHLWDDLTRTRIDSYLSCKTLDKLGILHRMDKSIKIDGVYWTLPFRVSDDDRALVDEYHDYLETKDAKARSRLNEAIEANLKKQEEDWEGERAIELIKWGAGEVSPGYEAVGKHWIDLLMDDDFVTCDYPLLLKKRFGEKYLLE